MPVLMPNGVLIVMEGHSDSSSAWDGYKILCPMDEGYESEMRFADPYEELEGSRKESVDRISQHAMSAGYAYADRKPVAI
ncbi:MAG: hypothetical protein EON58_21955 [Alphaproteobacteria bacterium]|nr:MAG: hypothetical protein EON58_21955 [Alphaproteobacteria bacterium]